MSALRLRRLLWRSRRSAAALAVACALSGIVALEHAGLAAMHEPAMAAVCLAVLPSALLVGRAPPPARPLWRPALFRAATTRVIATPPRAAPARAGPPGVLVLRL